MHTVGFKSSYHMPEARFWFQTGYGDLAFNMASLKPGHGDHLGYDDQPGCGDLNPTVITYYFNSITL